MTALAIRFWHLLAASILLLALGSGGPGALRVAHGFAGTLLGTLPGPVAKVALDPAAASVSSQRPDDAPLPPAREPSGPGLPADPAGLGPVLLATAAGSPVPHQIAARQIPTAQPRGPPPV